MAAIKRTATAKYYSLAFYPWGKQIWVATDERNKKNAQAIESEILKAVRRRIDYSELSHEAKVVCARMFHNQGLQPPEALITEFLNDGPVEPPPLTLTIERAFNQFLEYPEVKVSKSFSRYKQCLAHFIDYFDVRAAIDRIDVPVLKQYRMDKLDEGTAPGTINWQIGTLSKVFQVMIETGKLKVNPCRDLKSLSQKDGERDAYIGYSDYLMMLDEVGDWFRPIIQCAYLTGMRRNEIVELRKDHVIFEKRMIIIPAGNTKEYAWKRVPVCMELESILKDAISQTDSRCGYVFTINGHKTNPESFKRQWRLAVKNLELKPRFHDLRATWKVNARNSGIEEELRRSIMGHGNRSREVKERYGRILDAELVQAIDKMKYDFGPTVILTAK